MQGTGAIEARHDAVVRGHILTGRMIHHIFLARFPGVRVHVAMRGPAKQHESALARVGLDGVSQAGTKAVLSGAPKAALGGEQAFVVDVPMLAVFANVVFAEVIVGVRGRGVLVRLL